MDELILYIKSIVTIFAIPFAYIKSRKTIYEKVIKTIDEISVIVLNRLSSKYILTQHELQTLIRSRKINNLFTENAFSINNVIDSIIDKIETNPFINKIERRKLLESLIPLKLENTKSRIEFYKYLKNNQINILTIILILIVVITLLTPDKWKLFEQQELGKETFIELGFGLIISLVLAVLGFGYRKLFNGVISWGEPNFDPTSFKYLPSYHNEYLVFKNEKTKELKRFNLANVIYNSKGEIVETDPGCLNFGILRFKKYLKRFALIFKDDTDLVFIISLKKGSMVNGSIDFDYIEFVLENSSTHSVHKIALSSSSESVNIDEIHNDFVSVYQNHYKFLEAKGIQSIKIVLNHNKNLIGLVYANNYWKLINVI